MVSSWVVGSMLLGEYPCVGSCRLVRRLVLMTKFGKAAKSDGPICKPEYPVLAISEQNQGRAKLEDLKM
jgi:hypothetical protein